MSRTPLKKTVAPDVKKQSFTLEEIRASVDRIFNGNMHGDKDLDREYYRIPVIKEYIANKAQGATRLYQAGPQNTEKTTKAYAHACNFLGFSLLIINHDAPTVMQAARYLDEAMKFHCMDAFVRRAAMLDRDLLVGRDREQHVSERRARAVNYLRTASAAGHVGAMHFLCGRDQCRRTFLFNHEKYPDYKDDGKASAPVVLQSYPKEEDRFVVFKEIVSWGRSEIRDVKYKKTTWLQGRFELHRQMMREKAEDYINLLRSKGGRNHPIVESLIDFWWSDLLSDREFPTVLNKLFAKSSKYIMHRLLLELNAKQLGEILHREPTEHTVYETLQEDPKNLEKNILKIRARIYQLQQREMKFVFALGMGAKSNPNPNPSPMKTALYSSSLYDPNAVGMIFQFMHSPVQGPDAKEMLSSPVAPVGAVAAIATAKTGFVVVADSRGLSHQEFAAFRKYVDAVFEGNQECHEDFSFIETYMLHFNNEQLRGYLKARCQVALDIVNAPQDMKSDETRLKTACAYNFLGFCHLYFYNNYVKASVYFNEAIKLGCADASFHHGWMCILGNTGDGVRSYEAGVQCFELAASRGHGVAAHYVALREAGERLFLNDREFQIEKIGPNPRRELHFLEISIACGYKRGLCRAGDLYYAGYSVNTAKVQPNPWKALECYKQAGEAGVLTAAAMFNIARMFRDGTLTGKPDHFATLICYEAAEVLYGSYTGIRVGMDLEKDFIVTPEFNPQLAAKLINGLWDCLLKSPASFFGATIHHLKKYKALISQKLLSLDRIDQLENALEEDSYFYENFIAEDVDLREGIRARILYLKDKAMVAAVADIKGGTARDVKDDAHAQKAFVAAAAGGGTIFAARTADAAEAIAAVDETAAAESTELKALLYPGIVNIVLELITDALNHHQQEKPSAGCILA